ncbi:hypothetical protein SAMN05421752_102219 [Natronorubrum thiooxidans]|uniref:Uncharacterized protein n=1 Tax=Natronorubrum thiooxidans TaxID=308853 RepID=A0A1N7DFF4_9EURY|nr:hypothetical protein SAMN05421752_102219 [Natronorubrum thiooxidans]
MDSFAECATVGPASSGTEIRRKSPSPQEHSSETPIGLIVPSGCCSETYTESQARQTATILEWDSAWVMAIRRISTGITILPQYFGSFGAAAETRSVRWRLLDYDDRLAVDHRYFVVGFDGRVQPVACVAQLLDDFTGGGDGRTDFDRGTELQVL